VKTLDREILRLALPSILANITVPLVGLVDTAVAGHLHSSAGTSAEFIGGIAVGAMVLNVIYWNFAFLRASTGGLTAQAFGRKAGGNCPRRTCPPPDTGRERGPSQMGGAGVSEANGVPTGADSLRPVDECAGILQRALKLAMGFALLLIALGWPISRLALVFRDATPGVAALAIQYVLIRIWAAPATLSLMALKGWFIGMQDTVSSMLTDLTVNIVNIAASIILTLGIGGWQGLGFPGIAIGTVVAQYSGLLLAALLCRFRFRIQFCSEKQPETGTNARFNRGLFRKMAENGNKTGTNDASSGYRSFFRLNRDLFIRSLCMTGIYLGYTFIAAQYGETMLACANIIMNLLMLFSYFTDGFAYAGEALTGRFIGENNRKMLRQAVRGTFRWSFGVAGAWMLIYLLAGPSMLGLMTSDEGLTDACARFLPWLVIMPPLGCAAFTWDGIYVGATASKEIRNSMLWALAAFLAVWFCGHALLSVCGFAVTASPAGHGASPTAIHLLLAAYFAHLLARTVYLSVKYIK
jgi:MATE family multidrug resistance protein